MFESIRDFCMEEGLVFNEDSVYDRDLYLSCVSISTLNPMMILIKLTEYLIGLGYQSVDKLLRLIDYKSDGVCGTLYFLEISKTN